MESVHVLVCRLSDLLSALCKYKIIVICFQWKQNLAIHRFRDVCKVEKVVTCWLVTQDTDFHQQGIETLVPQCDTCATCSGDYVKK